MEEEKIEENQQASLIYELKFDEEAITATTTNNNNDDQNIIQEQQTNKIMNRGKLYLSGKEAAFDIKFLNENNIKAVLSLTSTSNPDYSNDDNINHILIDAQDSTTYDIEKDFDQAYDFIEQNLPKANLLIHCEKGISRSPTIAIAYIMRKEKKILSEVLNAVRKCRNIINPNGGFYFHLGRYCDKLKKVYSDDYNKHNLTKPTHSHNQNCKSHIFQNTNGFFNNNNNANNGNNNSNNGNDTNPQ